MHDGVPRIYQNLPFADRCGHSARMRQH
jgi:hypothetical protein